MNKTQTLLAQTTIAQSKGITTSSQLQVMLRLFNSEGKELPMKTIVKASKLSPPAITGIATKLKELGYIRIKPSLGDKRSRTIYLTYQGRWAVDNIINVED